MEVNHKTGIISQNWYLLRHDETQVTAFASYSIVNSFTSNTDYSQTKQAYPSGLR